MGSFAGAATDSFRSGGKLVTAGAPPAAFPQVIDSAVGNVKLPGATSYDLTIPAGVQADDLLLTFFSCRRGDAITEPSGYTSILDWKAAWSTHHGIAALKAAGTEGGTTLTWTSQATSTGSLCVLVIRDWGGTIATDIEDFANTGDNPGISSNADAPNIAPSWGSEKNLFIAYHSGFFEGPLASAWPTNYDHHQVEQNSVDGGPTEAGNDASTVVACRQLEAASDDPPQMTWTAFTAWVTHGVVVR